MTLAPLALAVGLGGTPVSPAGGELVQVAFWPRPHFTALEPWGATRSIVLAYNMVGVVRVGPGEELLVEWFAPGPYSGFNGLGVLSQGPFYLPGREDNFAIVDTAGTLLSLVPQEGPPWTLAVDGDALFVGPNSASYAGLQSYDIRDPLDPRFISSVLVGTNDLAITADHVFAGGKNRHDLAVLSRTAGDSLVLLDHEKYVCAARHIAYSAPWLLSSGLEEPLRGECQQVAKFEGDSLRIVRTELNLRFSSDFEVVENRIYAAARMEDDSTYGIATLEPREPAKLVLVDFLPLDRLEHDPALAWLESGYLLAAGGREGLILLAADPDGTLYERDRIGLPGKSHRFDLDGDLFVSAESGYGLRWARHPFDSEARELGHFEDGHWTGVAVVPGTDIIVASRSLGMVETFRLEEQPIPISSDSLSWIGQFSTVDAVPGFTVILNGMSLDLFALDEQGRLDHIEYLYGVGATGVALELWGDTLAFCLDGTIVDQELKLRTYVPGDTASVQRANWRSTCSGFPLDVDFLGREVAVATGCGVEIWDVSNPDAPRLSDEWDAPSGLLESVVLTPDLVIASSWADSLYVLDRTGPELRRIAVTMLNARADVQLGHDAAGRPHVVCNLSIDGYVVYTLREGRLARAPAPPPELWGFGAHEN